MRSSLMIFLVGVVLGSTLGIGGLWTQVVQPAYEEIKQLESDQGVMQQALDEAGATLEEVATTLRTDMDPVTGASALPATAQPLTPPARETTTALQPRERRALADRLDGLAGRINRVRRDE